MGEFTRPVEFTDTERRAIFVLREFYRDPDKSRELEKFDLTNRIQITDAEYQILMDRLGDMGIVEHISPRTLDEFEDGPYVRFSIDSRVCDIAHGIELEEAKASPPDLVEGVVRKARSHPWMSVGILLAIAMAFALTIVNGLFELLKNIADALSP